MLESEVRPAAEPIPGRTQITAQAMTSLAAAVAASQLQVPVRSVRAQVVDDASELGIRISAPISVTPLSARPVSSARAELPAESLIERAERLRGLVGIRVTELSGRTVQSVALRVTAARITTEKRVR